MITITLQTFFYINKKGQRRLQNKKEMEAKIKAFYLF